MIMAWVYILRGACGRHYIGSTEDLPRRMAEHERGSNHTTRRFQHPLQLADSRQFESIEAARDVERALKAMKSPSKALAALGGQVSESSPDPVGVG
jgi:putative endonuclease